MQALECKFDVKLAEDDAETMTFAGYGAIFGNVDLHGDVIQPGAFKDSLRRARKENAWPSMLLQHGGWLGGDEMNPVGIWTSLEEDKVGLAVEGKLAATARGREAYGLLKMEPRAALNGLSIGYLPKEWSAGTKPGEPRRTLKKVDLLEISLVTFPANPKARVASVKSGLTVRDAERSLRDAGFSREEAKAIAAEGWHGLGPRDAGSGPDELARAIERNIAALKSV